MSLEPIDGKDLDLGSKFGKPGAGQPYVEKPAGQSVEKPTSTEASAGEKESVKETISAEKDNVYSQILSKVKTSSVKYTDEEVNDDAQKVSEKQDAESQIQHLVDIAQTKGVFHAVKVAKHLEDNYVLDMFHDKLLSEELHDALIKKGLIDSSL